MKLAVFLVGLLFSVNVVLLLLEEFSEPKNCKAPSDAKNDNEVCLISGVLTFVAPLQSAGNCFSFKALDPFPPSVASVWD